MTIDAAVDGERPADLVSRTFPLMGTVVSLLLPPMRDHSRLEHVDAALADLRQVLAEMEARFSLYREASEASRIARGEVPLTRASREMRDMTALAAEWRVRTDGTFTPIRPDGTLDLAGVVKAAAIEGIGAGLDAAGVSDWLVNVGGDVLARGERPPGEAPWRVALVDPSDRGRTLGSVSLSGTRRSVATSGVAERGEHIWRAGPASCDSASSFVQVTVLADDIVTADVLATTFLAGGPAALDNLAGRFDVDVLAHDGAGELTATPGMRDLLLET